jgi:hypothetical protein
MYLFVVFNVFAAASYRKRLSLPASLYRSDIFQAHLYFACARLRLSLFLCSEYNMSLFPCSYWRLGGAVENKIS